MFMSALLALAQSGPTAATVVDGRVVSETTGLPIGGARVEPASNWGDLSPTVTDELGRWSFEPKPEVSSARPRRRALDQDEMAVAANGHASTTVDTSSHAPWANEIPLRPTRKLRGRMHGAHEGEAVYLELDARDCVWPPHTGLAISLKERGVALDPEGRFEIDAVPAQTSIRLRLGKHGQYRTLEQPFALSLDSADIIDFQAPPPTLKGDPTEEEPKGWQAVDCVPVEAQGKSPESAWFDVLPESRHIRHRVGGGRWHVHGNLPCNCIESRNGARVLVARDCDGWFGVQAIQVSDETIGKKHRIVIVPGGLLRLHLGKDALASRVSLRANGLVFATREVAPDSIWYELAPPGGVDILIGADGSARPARTITVEAGKVARVELEPD